MGRKTLVAVVLLSVLVFLSCASTKETVVEYEPEEFAIHDVVFMDEYPDNYDGVIPVKSNSFVIGETKILCIRFGGLEVDEENCVSWAVIIEVFYQGSFSAILGPEYFKRDLDEKKVMRDKYMVVLPLEMYKTLNTGEYLFNVYIVDALNYRTVEESIEFTVSQTM